MEWLLLPKGFDNKNLRTEPHVYAEKTDVSACESDEVSAPTESQV